MSKDAALLEAGPMEGNMETNLCANCFAGLTASGGTCPVCGWDNSTPQPPEALPFSLLLRFGEVGVDHIVVGFLAASRPGSGLGARGTGGVSSGLLALSLRVELFGQFVRCGRSGNAWR